MYLTAASARQPLSGKSKMVRGWGKKKKKKTLPTFVAWKKAENRETL